MTQIELAKRASVTQAAIAQIERGIYPASDSLTAAICEITELPQHFFEQETSPPIFPLGSLLFHAHAPLSKREKVEAYRHAQLTYELLLFLYADIKRIRANIQKLTDEPAEAARLTRRALGVALDEPVPHLLNILEHHGAIVLRMPQLKKRDAFSLWVEDTPLIAISDGLSGDRLRIACAHELGHLVMHSKKMHFRVDEGDADSFASEFLLPAKAMRRELRHPVTLSHLAELKPRWKVPIKALIYRAREVRVLTTAEQDYLIEQFSLEGWDKSEPVDLRAERPRALRQLAEIRYGNPIDHETLSRDANLTPKIIREILDCYAPKKPKAHSDEERDLPVKGKVIRLSRQQMERE